MNNKLFIKLAADKIPWDHYVGTSDQRFDRNIQAVINPLNISMPPYVSPTGLNSITGGTYTRNNTTPNYQAGGTYPKNNTTPNYQNIDDLRKVPQSSFRSPNQYANSINNYLNTKNSFYYTGFKEQEKNINDRFTTAKLYYDPATKTNRSWNDAIADAGKKWQQSGSQEDRLRYVALRLQRNAQKWNAQNANRSNYINSNVAAQRSVQNEYLANKNKLQSQALQTHNALMAKDQPYRKNNAQYMRSKANLQNRGKSMIS